MTTKKGLPPTTRAQRPPVSKGDLVWGFAGRTMVPPGKLQWTSGIVISIEHRDLQLSKYEVLWSDGSIERQFRHEISLPHEAAPTEHLTPQ